MQRQRDTTKQRQTDRDIDMEAWRQTETTKMHTACDAVIVSERDTCAHTRTNREQAADSFHSERLQRSYNSTPQIVQFNPSNSKLQILIPLFKLLRMR